MPEFASAAVSDYMAPAVQHAIGEIRKFDGYDVSVTRKSKSLRKFGRLLDIDDSGYKTVWGGNAINNEEPLFGDPARGNTIDTIVSAGGSDTQTITIEGHTKSGDDLTFGTQTAVLNGQTEVALSTPLHVVTRAYNSSSTDFTGPVYIFDNTDGSSLGVPTDPSDVGAYLAGTGEEDGQQSESAFTAVSANDYFIITALTASINRQQTAAVDMVFERRTTTGVWLPMGAEIGLATGGTTTIRANFEPAIVVPRNSYIRVRAKGSSATATTGSANFAGYLAAII